MPSCMIAGATTSSSSDDVADGLKPHASDVEYCVLCHNFIPRGSDFAQQSDGTVLYGPCPAQPGTNHGTGPCEQFLSEEGAVRSP